MIETPAEGRVLFLPQKPYLPIGTLRGVLSYPDPPTRFDGHAMADTLTKCGLARLVGRLEESRHWALELSPGEQQRLAFARALLQRPNRLFLDEATASLDEVSEHVLYRLLRQELPGATIISVAHRSALAAFHDRRLGLGGSLHDATRAAKQHRSQETVVTGTD